MHRFMNGESDIVKISEQLEKLRRKGIKQDVLEDILGTLIPVNEKYQVKGVFENCSWPAFFNTDDKTIHVSLEKLKKYINKRIYHLTKIFPFFNYDELLNIYVLFVLIHEVEHVYQYLIGNEYVEFPYRLVIDAYRNIFSFEMEVFNPIYGKLIEFSYLQQARKCGSLLERNVNVEAYDILSKVAEYENNLKINEFLEKQKSYCLLYGYKGIFNGAVEETYYKSLLGALYKKFPKDEDIPLKDRVRYGLPIDRETRKKVLTRKFEI